MNDEYQKKIYITGIAGFLGSHLADYWLSQGSKVVGCDNLSGGNMINVPKGAHCFQQDITKSLDGLYMTMEGCDILYHCAAAPYEGVSVFSPSYISDNIFSGSVNVFTAAIKAGVKRIVYCSSMARYGSIRTPYKEYMIPRPQDPYGIAKEAAERTLQILSEVHGIEYCIAVPHNIYGPRQKYDDPYRNVASIMINRMLQGNQPIIYGDGNQERCFSYVDDCIECLAKMGTQYNVLKEIINIGPDENPITINDLAKYLASYIGFDLDPIYMPDRPKEVKVAKCSSDLARKLLGYQTKIDIDSGMKLLVDWITSQGKKEFQYGHVPLEIITDKTPKTWKEKLI